MIREKICSYDPYDGKEAHSFLMVDLSLIDHQGIILGRCVKLKDYSDISRVRTHNIMYESFRERNKYMHTASLGRRDGLISAQVTTPNPSL